MPDPVRNDVYRRERLRAIEKYKDLAGFAGTICEWLCEICVCVKNVFRSDNAAILFKSKQKRYICICFAQFVFFLLTRI